MLSQLPRPYPSRHHRAKQEQNHKEKQKNFQHILACKMTNRLTAKIKMTLMVKLPCMVRIASQNKNEASN